MKMETKYYTPTIEEFHVGFEIYLENIENAKIGLYIVTKNDMLSATHDEVSGMYDIIKEAKVKYLNKEDIESLGWVYDEDYPKLWNHYKLGKYYLTMGNTANNINPYKITIDNGELFENNELYFQGIIKNKSELTKLMKQLGI